MNKKILAIFVVAAAAGLGLSLSQRYFGVREAAVPVPKMQTANVIDTPRALPAFSLQTAGGTLSAETLKGSWTVVFVGFTHCPDICPTTLTELAQAQAIWAKSNLSNKPKLLFLSIDPERDTPEALADYAAFFNKDTLTATAQEPQLGEFTRALGLVYMKVPQGDTYTMDHSATLVLLNPDAEFAGIIRPPLDPQAIAQDLLTLSKNPL
ncbi:MAG TPA: SCO family protein [Arenimonas sp.]|nr:SCO family protein [Arenimonas sp.]